MKIAIPTFGCRVSPRFDCAQSILLVTVNQGKVISRQMISVEEGNPLRRTSQLSELGVDTVVCGGIHEVSSRLLADYGIRVISWVTGDIEEIIHLFLSDKLHPGTTTCHRRKRRRKGPPWCS